MRDRQLGNAPLPFMKIRRCLPVFVVLLGISLSPHGWCAGSGTDELPVAGQYRSAKNQLAALKGLVRLSSDQERQALRIFQTLKETMDAIPPGVRAQQGAPARQDARAAIRALLTPDQQKIYDSTPQSRGGGSTRGDPERMAFNQKVRAFVISSAQASSEISAQVGRCRKSRSIANETRPCWKASRPGPKDRWAATTSCRSPAPPARKYSSFHGP
jgi:hypothetical protein